MNIFLQLVMLERKQGVNKKNIKCITILPFSHPLLRHVYKIYIFQSISIQKSHCQ